MLSTAYKFHMSTARAHATMLAYLHVPMPLSMPLVPKEGNVDGVVTKTLERVACDTRWCIYCFKTNPWDAGAKGSTCLTRHLFWWHTSGHGAVHNVCDQGRCPTVRLPTSSI